MFLGHYALGLAAKKAAPKLSLSYLLLACNFLDLIWPIFVLLGIERVAADPTATAVTPLNFEFYPYSHSLLMSGIWAIVVGGLFFIFKKNKPDAIILGLLVLSHWFLDLIVHRPDLPITLLNDTKVGFGIWNSVVLSLALEFGLWTTGILVYTKATGSKQPRSFWILIVFMTIIYLANTFGPKPEIGTPAAMIAGPAVALWLVVFWGWWIDRQRQSN